MFTLRPNTVTHYAELEFHFIIFQVRPYSISDLRATRCTTLDETMELVSVALQNMEAEHAYLDEQEMERQEAAVNRKKEREREKALEEEMQRQKEEHLAMISFQPSPGGGEGQEGDDSGDERGDGGEGNKGNEGNERLKSFSSAPWNERLKVADQREVADEEGTDEKEEEEGEGGEEEDAEEDDEEDEEDEEDEDDEEGDGSDGSIDGGGETKTSTAAQESGETSGEGKEGKDRQEGKGGDGDGDGDEEEARLAALKRELKDRGERAGEARSERVSKGRLSNVSTEGFEAKNGAEKGGEKGAVGRGAVHGGALRAVRCLPSVTCSLTRSLPPR